MSPVAPVSGPVTSPFGKRASGFHKGMDFGVPDGTPIHANRAGTIIRAGYDYNTPSFGWHVRQQAGDLVLIYGHMQSAPYVKVGQHVAEGQVIGPSGHSGNAFGPHVHFEVRKGGAGPQNAVNPAPYLTGGAAGPSSDAGYSALGSAIGAVVGGFPGAAIGGAVGGTAGVGEAVVGGVGSALSGLDAVGGFFSALSEKGTWVRVLQVLGGAALLIGGVVIVGKGVVSDVAVAAMPGGAVLKAAAGK